MELRVVGAIDGVPTGKIFFFGKATREIDFRWEMGGGDVDDLPSKCLPPPPLPETHTHMTLSPRVRERKLSFGLQSNFGSTNKGPKIGVKL